MTSTLDPDDPRHGTRNAYAAHDCRCPGCRRANTEYTRLRRLRKRGQAASDPAGVPHGNAGYTEYGCRCAQGGWFRAEPRGPAAPPRPTGGVVTPEEVGQALGPGWEWQPGPHDGGGAAVSGHAVEKRSVRLEWKPQDCWVGVFWKHSGNYRAGGTGAVDVWICLLPMVPLHYRRTREWVQP